MFEGESLKMKMLDLDVGFDRGAGEEIFHFDETEFCPGLLLICGLG